VDTPELAAMVPELMVRHRTHDWTIVSGNAPGEYLRIELRPVTAADRLAVVVVFPGAEIFVVEFAGSSSAEFAYDDTDRREVLDDRLSLAAAATLGPTRVTLHRAGGVTVAASVVVNLSGPRQQDWAEDWPLRRLKARLKGRQVTQEIVDFPALLST
jgi:hypothetical protein